MRKFLLAIFASVSTVTAIESFFRLNESYHWVNKFHSESTTPELENLKILSSPQFDRFRNLPMAPEHHFRSTNVRREIQPRTFKDDVLVAGPYVKTLLEFETNEVLHQYRFTMDAFGRRWTPPPEKSANKFLFVLGCSFVFGDGVNDEETLPAMLQRLAPGFRSYNFGKPGMAANDLVLEFDKSPDRAFGGISEHSGIALYVHIDLHLQRVLGSAKLISSSPHHENNAYYAGRPPRHLGRFSDRRWLTPFYKLYSKLALTDFFDMDLPILGPAQFQLYADLIKELENQTKKHGATKMFFVFFPGETRYRRELVPLLKKHGIEVLDYSSVNGQEITNNNFILKEEGDHPTPYAYELLARLIIEDLPLK